MPGSAAMCCGENSWRRCATIRSCSARVRQFLGFVTENEVGRSMDKPSVISMPGVTPNGLICSAILRRLYQWAIQRKACPSVCRSLAGHGKRSRFSLLLRLWNEKAEPGKHHHCSDLQFLQRWLDEKGIFLRSVRPLWLNLYPDESENFCRTSGCDRRRFRSTQARRRARSNRRRALQQSWLRLHESAALRKGIEGIPESCGSRSQAGGCAPERRRRLSQPAEDRRGEVRAAGHTEARSKESERLVQPGSAGKKHRRRASLNRRVQARDRD